MSRVSRSRFLKAGAASAAAALAGARSALALPHRHPLPVTTFRVAEGSPSVGTIDADVFAVMEASDVHAASLAIVNGTRLVYAKGYAQGRIVFRSQYPPVYPTTYFRQASVSKFVTALATMQLIAENKLSLSTTMQSVLNLKNKHGGAPADPRFGNITIQHLLEMRSGLNPNLPAMDATIASALGVSLPITPANIGTYAASTMLQYTPGNRAMAAYDNANYTFLGYVVAKLRGVPSLVQAIESPLMNPLGITRIRAGRPLIGEQAGNEARYFPNPYQTAKSVMSPSQPTVELGYGEFNFANDEGAGGLSAAATDIARLLAAVNLGDAHNPAFSSGTLANWLDWAYAAFHDSAFASGSFGFYGLDALNPIGPGGTKPPYQFDKGGLLSTSQNAIYLETGGFGYVINWSSLTPSGESWYPVFHSVLSAAKAHNWGSIDLFPSYGMSPL